jgi:hypothetical protein
VEPIHSGPLLFVDGVAGVGFITTVTLVGMLEQPLLAVTVYVPEAASVTFEIEGFCCVLVNPFGPAHDQVAPVIESTVSCNVDPEQTGLLLDATGVTGVALTAAATVPVELEHPFTVTTSE